MFGPNLPDKDSFFATYDNPMCLLDLKREGWKTWDNFLSAYHEYCKAQVKPVETKAGTLPKTVTKDAAK